MADVTINQLTRGTPAGSNILPYSTGSVTLGVPVSAIFQNAGNIGINTSSPDHKLTVNAASDNVGGILVTGSNAPAIRFNDTTDGSSYSLVCGQNNGALVLAADESNTAAGSLISFRVDTVERMRIDANGNVGIGLLPNAWSTGIAALQLGGSSCIWSDRVAGLRTFYGTNYYYDGTNRKYIAAGAATEYLQAVDGAHVWYNAAAGAAAATVTLTERLRIAASGSVGIGTSNPQAILDVNGDVRASNTAKAWVNFNGTGSTGANQTIRASYNVSSVFKNGTGDYTIYFTTPMVDNNYCASTMGWQANPNINSVYAWPKATSSYSTTFNTDYIRVASGTPHIAGAHNESYANADAVLVSIYR